ncbi:tRNA (adenosine(37)-N6)-threonylcarbamoyltransferase complex transferase subunit TsaD [Candidatus Daviesbacteria bacterium]|nr:tRNA (adenosine(37)-N6)-threonylcarbamoyltransferase complex transferase subunit TsaD [Candidatus Daviesbacteria bacterium]
MIILGIETSCDETAAAVLTNNDNRITILSNVVASSASLQAKYGGIIPEQAAREQLRSIIPVIQEALTQAFPNYQLPTTNYPPIDAIAVTYGPGLIGSLLVGVETAKTLALVWNRPLIPVNHLIGHFYANWVEISQSDIEYRISEEKNDSRLTITDKPSFPCIGLLVSGGHTDLVLFTDHGKYKYLGGTRDDAAGECFDKCARLLGLSYPGGPQISKLAQKGNPKAFDLPRPMIDSKDFDFSFSGLKTSVANFLSEHEKTAKSRARKNVVQLSAPQTIETTNPELGTKQTPSERSGRASGFFSRDELANLAASIESAIVDVLVAKTIKAAKIYKVKNIMIAGGVASNKKLREQFLKTINDSRLTINLAVPPPHLCTDNAAMIAAAAFFLPRGKAGQKPIATPLKLQADPSLALA